MIILGMDTSSTVASIAISEDEKLVGEFSINSKNTHSQKLMIMIESLFDQLSLTIFDVDIFAISRGPGSFTGLRIGMTTAKSFAYALDKKIVGISSLEMMANSHRYFEGIVVPMMDARNERVFASAYIAERGGLKGLISEEAMEVSQLLSDLDRYQEQMIFIGDGASTYRKNILSKMGSRAIIAGMDVSTPKASSLCQMVFENSDRQYDDYFTVVPEYLRESQAQQQKKAKSDG